MSAEIQFNSILSRPMGRLKFEEAVLSQGNSLLPSSALAVKLHSAPGCPRYWRWMLRQWEVLPVGLKLHFLSF